MLIIFEIFIWNAPVLECQFYVLAKILSHLHLIEMNAMKHILSSKFV